MKVLVAALPEKGHLHPLLAPAQALARRGHEVRIDAPPPGEDNRGPALAALIADAERLRHWIRALLLDGVPAEVERLHAVVREFRPDVIAADAMAYAAPIVAALENLPWAALSTSLNPVVPDSWTSELIATNAWLARDRDALFAGYGLRAKFRVCDCLSPSLTIAFTTEALVGVPPPGVTLGGPSLGARDERVDFDGSRLDGRPLVYASFGSQNWHQPRALATLLAASKGQPWQLVVAVGGMDLPSLPENVVAVPYAPQLALLARARVAVTHGGANSVMEALAHGVPLLVSPFCNDQPHNARFVAAAGAGIVLRLDEATPAQGRAAIAESLESPSLRAAAAAIGASYASRDGGEIAAAAIEALA